MAGWELCWRPGPWAPIPQRSQRSLCPDHSCVSVSSIHPSIHCPSSHPSITSSILSIYPSTHPSSRPFIYYSSIYPPTCPSSHPSVCLQVFIALLLFAYLFMPQPTACGILAPDRGRNPSRPAVEPLLTPAWAGKSHFLYALLCFTDNCVCCVFSKLKFCGNPMSSKSVGSIFPKASLTSCLCVTF